MSCGRLRCRRCRSLSFAVMCQPCVIAVNVIPPSSPSPSPASPTKCQIFLTLALSALPAAAVICPPSPSPVNRPPTPPTDHPPVPLSAPIGRPRRPPATTSRPPLKCLGNLWNIPDAATAHPADPWHLKFPTKYRKITSITRMSGMRFYA